ncbi:hypothetical protein MLE32_000515 [Klebsiella aerogenes]|nr:hypothetical protein [Klebsiella aerogenes]
MNLTVERDLKALVLAVPARLKTKQSWPEPGAESEFHIGARFEGFGAGSASKAKN